MFIAHSPLGGPKRAKRADAVDALGRLLALSPAVVPIPGATRPETVRSVVRATPVHGRVAERTTRAEVVLIMGIPGAGKSRIADEYVERGYVRLNRDERGGTLRELTSLVADHERVVLDNTYLTRASRNDVVATGARVHCIWIDTPLAQAQVNLVERLLDRFGRLPEPDELKRSRVPGVMAPTSQMRALRGLEPPSDDEGFASIERVEFAREPREGIAGTFVAAPCWPVETDGPTLVFDWRTGPLEIDGVDTAVCPHGGGPPVCWCRPPLPGLLLEFARRRGVDPARSTLVGTSNAHRTLAATLGARFTPQP